jgi:uncharacterized protein YwgA
MTPFQLAKIVNWAGTLKTRKRLQKVVYLLQSSGAPIKADYTLHHYGPYASDVAHLTDQMVQTGLLVEQEESNMIGKQFSYKLSAAAAQQLAELEKKPEMIAPFAPFEATAKKLINADLKILEIASTVAYFHKQGKTWTEAVQCAAQFKSIPADGQLMRGATELARGLMN